MPKAYRRRYTTRNRFRSDPDFFGDLRYKHGWVVALVWANTADVEPETPDPALTEPSWMRKGGGPISPGAGPGVASRSSAPSGERVCPFCAETVKSAAIVCKHCGRDLEPAAPSVSEPPSLEAEALRLGVVWSPEIERYVWRGEFFKDQAKAVEFAQQRG